MDDEQKHKHRVKFGVPEYFHISTGERIKMAFNIMNDVITKIRLEFDNLAGVPVAMPAGTETVSLVDSTGAVSALGTVAMGTMSNGDPAVIVTPAAKGVTVGDATILFDDAANIDLKANLDISFTMDPTAANAHFDTTTVETVPFP